MANLESFLMYWCFFLDLWLIVFPWFCPWYMLNILIGWLSWILHYLLILFPCIYPLIYAGLSWLIKQIYFLSFLMHCIFLFLFYVLCAGSFLIRSMFDWFSSFFSCDGKSVEYYWNCFDIKGSNNLSFLIMTTDLIREGKFLDMLWYVEAPPVDMALLLCSP